MKTIKCPNCGSSAQINLVWREYSSYGTQEVKEYECGCGCYFEVIFEAKLINIKK